MKKSDLIAEIRVIADWIEEQSSDQIDTAKASAMVREMALRFDKSFSFDWNQPTIFDSLVSTPRPESMTHQVQSTWTASSVSLPTMTADDLRKTTEDLIGRLDNRSDNEVFFHPGTMDDFRRTVDRMNNLPSAGRSGFGTFATHDIIQPNPVSYLPNPLAGLDVIDRQDLDPPGVYVGTMRALRRAGVVPGMDRAASDARHDARMQELIREGRIGPR